MLRLTAIASSIALVIVSDLRNKNSAFLTQLLYFVLRTLSYFMIMMPSFFVINRLIS